MQRYFSEVVGTFALVFVGCGAIIVNDQYDGVMGHLGIAFAFGLVVMTMIYAVGDLSGAHLNPAVTITFAFVKRFPWNRVPPYIAAQCLGALAASGTWALVFPDHVTLGTTAPQESVTAVFVLEMIITGMLMFVILRVSTGAKEKGITAAIAIGGTVFMLALVVGPITGASMNPARSLGPALVSGQLNHLWLYLAAPVLGALLGGLHCRLTEVPREEPVPPGALKAQDA